MRSPRRMMCASVLCLECIVLGLVTPVLIAVEDVSTSKGLLLGVGLAVCSVVVAGLLRFEWAYLLGFGVQVAAVGLGFFVVDMFVLGAIFGALYTAAYVLGRKIETQQASLGS